MLTMFGPPRAFSQILCHSEKNKKTPLDELRPAEFDVTPYVVRVYDDFLTIQGVLWETKKIFVL